MKITLSKNNFNPNPYYTLPIDLDESIDLKSTIDTFDQNGFDLTDLEILYAKKMDLDIKKVRHTHFVLKDDWFTAEPQ